MPCSYISLFPCFFVFVTLCIFLFYFDKVPDWARQLCVVVDHSNILLALRPVAGAILPELQYVLCMLTASFRTCNIAGKQ